VLSETFGHRASSRCGSQALMCAQVRALGNDDPAAAHAAR
jgi:hypothetical protein